MPNDISVCALPASRQLRISQYLPPPSIVTFSTNRYLKCSWPLKRVGRKSKYQHIRKCIEYYFEKIYNWEQMSTHQRWAYHCQNFRNLAKSANSRSKFGKTKLNSANILKKHCQLLRNFEYRAVQKVKQCAHLVDLKCTCKMNPYLLAKSAWIQPRTSPPRLNCSILTCPECKFKI